MTLKMRLTVTTSVIMVAATAIVVTLLLLLSYRSQTRLSRENLKNLTGIESKSVQITMEKYMDMINTISYIMNSFEYTEEDQRRGRYDEVMVSAISSVTELVGIATVWKDGIIDSNADAEGKYYPYRTWYQRQNSLDPERDDYANSGIDYQAILNSITNSPQIGNVTKGKMNGEEVFCVDLIAPIIPADDESHYDGQIIGFVVATVSLKFAEEAIVNIRPFEKGRAVLYAHDGTIAAHYNPEMIGKHISDPDSVRVLGQKAVEDTLRTLQNGSGEFDRNRGRYFYSYPFFVGQTTTAWTILSSIEEKVVLADVRAMLMLAIIISVIAIAVTVIIIWFMSRSISQRITRVGAAIKDISEGEGDLTRRLTIHANDEIGAMGTYFNSTMEKIRLLVLSIKTETHTLSDIGGELSTNMTETAASINQMNATIQSLKSQVMNQSTSVTETNSTMQQIINNIDKLGELVDKQTTSVSQSSSAVEEMIASIQSVTQTLIKNGANVKALADSSEVGRSGLQDVAQDIQQIARESEGLLEINAVMENIASQTNLLSMNAAIEAAHAGEAGKGFAVVADEIRKLAESSGEQSKTISSVLKKIKDSIDKITRSTDAVLNKFEAIDSGVKTVSDQEHNIRNAMEEQNAGSQQILEAMNRLNEVTGMVKDSTTEMLQGTQQVVTESRNLGHVTQELENGMNEMASGAEQINTAVERVNMISGDNKQHIDNLVGEVSKFIVE
ncbi:MAG: methyl-accepting chemotaxis protein [Spirochaetaceae bacterium]|jgi:methyl-accepting chemotaxis protein|nr:methyl-accepting chemotaxis protein [Spirochaetaceae bacterium]